MSGHQPKTSSVNHLSCHSSRLKMQGITKALRFHGKQLKLTVLQHMNKGIFSWATLISRIQTESPTVIIPHIGLENIRVREILNAKGEAKAGAVYWCCTSHFVHEAIKHVSVSCSWNITKLYQVTKDHVEICR